MKIRREYFPKTRKYKDLTLFTHILKKNHINVVRTLSPSIPHFVLSGILKSKVSKYRDCFRYYIIFSKKKLVKTVSTNSKFLYFLKQEFLKHSFFCNLFTFFIICSQKYFFKLFINEFSKTKIIYRVSETITWTKFQQNYT